MRNGLGSEIRNTLSSLFVKKRVDNPLLMRADIFSDLTNVSERSSQRIQFIINNIFYAGWHQMIVMETTCLQTVDIYYCGGICSTVHETNILSDLTDVSERLAQMIQFLS
jgi:hypothetical protein